MREVPPHQLKEGHKDQIIPVEEEMRVTPIMVADIIDLQRLEMTIREETEAGTKEEPLAEKETKDTKATTHGTLATMTSQEIALIAEMTDEAELAIIETQEEEEEMADAMATEMDVLPLEAA